MKNPNIEPRMYRETREKLAEKTQKDGFTVKRKTNTVVYGVDTNNVTRKAMFDLLPEIIDTEYDKFVSPNIYSDLKGLEKKKTGKIEHRDGGHDDNLMSYLIFRYAVYYGKCFKDKFGINPVPSRVNVKTQSAIGDIKRIERVISKAISASNNSEYYENNSMYNTLVNQERIKKYEDDNSSSTNDIDSFFRIMGDYF